MEKISIYLVEDYEFARFLCKNELSKVENFDVIGDFEKAEDCIKAMEEKPADIILMDLGLPFPYMNGIEATRILSEKFPDSKVIILTSHEQEKEVLACAASGASGYAIKDVTYDNLIKVINVVNFGAQWFDPQFANITKSAMPKPVSTDFDNLYPSSFDIKSTLTEKEFATLELISKGKSNIEIADIMMVSTNTAKSHVKNILSKLAVGDRVEAAVKAVKANLF